MSNSAPTKEMQPAIRAHRFYETISRNGNPIAFVAKTGALTIAERSAATNAADGICKSEIEAWTTDCGIECTPALLTDLHEAINIIRVTTSPKEAVSPTHPMQLLQSSLRGLEENLPSAISEVSGFANLSGAAAVGYNVGRAKELLYEINKFQRSVERIRRYVKDDALPVNHKFQTWHDDALYLALLLKSGRTGNRVGETLLSVPVLRFISLALNRASGALIDDANPAKARWRTEDNVRKALARHPQKTLLSLDLMTVGQFAEGNSLAEDAAPRG